MDKQYYNQNAPEPIVFHNTVESIMNEIVQVIGATFGPYGTHNLFMSGQELISSKDGFENLMMFETDGSISKSIIHMAREVAHTQSDVIGDGTTTSLLVLAHVYKRLRSASQIWEESTPSAIHREIKSIQNDLVQILEGQSKKLESDKDVFSIAYTSTDRSLELTDLITDIFTQLQGVIDTNIILTNTNSQYSSFSQSSGFEFEARLPRPEFANGDVDQFSLENTNIILVDGAPQIDIGIIEGVVNKMKQTGESLLIMCTGIQSMNFLHFVEQIAKTQPGVLANIAVVYVKLATNMNGSTFRDLMRQINAPHVEEGTMIDTQFLQNFAYGKAKYATYKNRKITLTGFDDQNDQLKAYIESMKKDIDHKESELVNIEDASEHKAVLRAELGNLKSRYQRLTHGTTTVFVGGETTQRRSINYRLIEDGIKAIQSAYKTGYFEGCSSATLNALHTLFHMYYGQDRELTLRSQLVELIMNAYIDTFGHLIGNKQKIGKSDFLVDILTVSPEAVFEDTAQEYLKFKTDTDSQNYYAPFKPINLSDDAAADRILNPAGTDILIIEKSVDLAVVLATANTIMTSQTEFTTS